MSQVIVVGAGPVGLSTALGLAQSGVEVEVLEARATLSDEARASTIHPPTLEFFERLGVADSIIERGVRVDRLQYWERSTKTLVAELNYRAIAEDTPYPFRLQCPQSRVIPVLAEALGQTGCGRIRFGHRVTALAQDEHGVEVTVATDAGETRLRASYLVAADGANSTIRDQLGLSFSGKTFEDRFLLVLTDVDLEHYGYAGIGPVAYMFDPSEWVITMKVPGTTRVVFRLRQDEDPEQARQPEAVQARMQGLLGTSDRIPTGDVSVYRVHQRVAENFWVDRVLLAGDAAHINNPAGGMGMNSGIHDAEQLVEGVIGVVGGGGDQGLERYAQMRRRVAVEQVQAHTGQHYGELTEQDDQARRERNRLYAEAAADPEATRRWLLTRAMLEDRI